MAEAPAPDAASAAAAAGRLAGPAIEGGGALPGDSGAPAAGGIPIPLVAETAQLPRPAVAESASRSAGPGPAIPSPKGTSARPSPISQVCGPWPVAFASVQTTFPAASPSRPTLPPSTPPGPAASTVAETTAPPPPLSPPSSGTRALPLVGLPEAAEEPLGQLFPAAAPASSEPPVVTLPGQPQLLEQTLGHAFLVAQATPPAPLPSPPSSAARPVPLPGLPELPELSEQPLSPASPAADTAAPAPLLSPPAFAPRAVPLPGLPELAEELLSPPSPALDGGGFGGGHGLGAGADAPDGPDGPAPPARPLPPGQLPVVDLIGLRFSLQHLRLVGYGLLAVWVSEMVNLLSSPRLAEIGTRLHYTSQFLDLSPILLVAIGLIAFQGGLRRRPLEVLLLPLLMALLPLLSALHFFLAPVSVANVVTLVQKQQQIGLDQLERIDQQIDRAASILRDSDSIDALLEGLQRIPGLQVRVPPRASVSEARREVRRSLERERDRLRERIEGNLTASRESFMRRAATNAVLALLMGLLLWGVHHGAIREMEQAIPFLDWVLVHGEQQQQPEALQELLRFQRACVALGWFALMERWLRLVRRVVLRKSAEELAEEQAEEERLRQAAAEPPPNPFEPSQPRAAGMTSLPLPLFARLRPPLTPVLAFEPLSGDEDGDEDAPGDSLAERMKRRQATAEPREQRRRQRDLDRYRALRDRIEREGRDPFALFAGAEPADASGPDGSEAAGWNPVAGFHRRRRWRRLQRDQRRAREALRRMALSHDMLLLQLDPQDRQEHELGEELQRLQAMPGPPPRPRGLAGLWRWFLSNL